VPKESSMNGPCRPFRIQPSLGYPCNLAQDTPSAKLPDNELEKKISINSPFLDG
jgi:hypothetical protein